MATNPTLLTTPIAENGTKNVIPAVQAAAGDGLLSQSTGFPAETSLPLGAGGKAPTREDMNGALYLLSKLAFYNQKGWFFQFDANQAYFATCVVRDTTDGQLYEARNDVAAGGSVPSADNTNWKKFFPVGRNIGDIFPHAGTSQPPGALLCNGAAVSRTMYADLFDEIGTTYGAGDGSTTFNLPNLVAKFIEGDLTSGTVKAAGLPNITGEITIAESGKSILRATQSVNDALYSTNAVNLAAISTLSSTGTANSTLHIDASRSSAIYGNSTTVQPPALTMKYYIQAFTDSTDPALVDLTQILQDLANKLTREQTPAFNKRDVITTSGTYTAPVTGWYKITVKGGGGGGAGANKIGTGNNNGRTGGSGGEGGTTIAWEKMTAGQTATVVIGSGGQYGAAGDNNGSAGGNSTVTVNNTTYTGGGGSGGLTSYQSNGGTGTIAGAGGIAGSAQYMSIVPSQQSFEMPKIGSGYGKGGSGGSFTFASSGSYASNGNWGGNGAVFFEYFDPTLN